MEGKYGDPTAALDYVTVAVRGYHDSGNAVLIRTPLVVVTVLFDRLGRHEPADTIAGFASDHPLAVAVVPEIETAIAHLHEVLGTPAYESLARDGEKMMTAEMVRYAYDRIDQARTELNAVSHSVSTPRTSILP